MFSDCPEAMSRQDEPAMAYTAEKAFELIEAAHQRGRLAHAFLITGEAGSGKSELAAKVISLINPPEQSGGMNLFGEPEEVPTPDLESLEGDLVRIVSPKSKSRRIVVDDIRELEKSFYVASATGKWKVGVIQHADRMGVGAENAFLKTLEEPPADCLLLLLSDAPELLLPTILSRCVRLPLMAKAEGREVSESQRVLLDALAGLAKQGMGNIAQALTLRSAFSELLVKRRAEIAKLNDLALKEETAKYKNTTDGEWLKHREDYYKGHTESEYLGERERLLEVLIAWMGDVVRQKCGVERLDFPSQKATTETVASKHELADLLQRMDALENLRTNLETNVQEQLALEVAFLKAYA
ncbi:hypothetical protein JO972_02370 [Verrucomicrobiaceae bacterium 5K15]|uniref:DNA polymerase III subunit delta n=2 Tax=Oceaniferula flava TaxID=2800421 RepID=A0AAE2SCK5_9BACT|nr:hypothetical protein [Oceaniferula flavus]MBM1135097.1 hypothetical protein [Oceaniferula flavus]